MNEAVKKDSSAVQGWSARLQKWWDEATAKSPEKSGEKAGKTGSNDSGGARRSKPASSLQQSLRDNKVSIISIGLLLLLSVTYFVVYWPKYRDLQEQENKIARIEQINAEIAQKKIQLEEQTAALTKEEQQHQYLLSSFFTQKELDRLFGNISLWAEDYRLQIEKIEKPNETLSKSSPSASSQESSSIKPIHIDIELTGKFFDYLALRNEVLSIDKALSIVNEEINVTSSGTVSVAFVMEVYIQDTTS